MKAMTCNCFPSTGHLHMIFVLHTICKVIESVEKFNGHASNVLNIGMQVIRT